MSAARVSIYNPDTFRDEDSKREYVEVGEIVQEVEADWGAGYTKVHTTVYMDPTTGLLVGDVHAYEMWVRS